MSEDAYDIAHRAFTEIKQAIADIEDDHDPVRQISVMPPRRICESTDPRWRVSFEELVDRLCMESSVTFLKVYVLSELFGQKILFTTLSVKPRS